MVTLWSWLLLLLMLVMTKEQEWASGQCPEPCKCGVLQDLRTANCSGAKLLSAVVQNVEHVQVLDLSHNIIAHLMDDELTNLNQLRVLNLSQNLIFDISLRAFHAIPNIIVIDLSRNRLHSLIPEVFVENTQLRELHLSNNKFTTFSSGPFLQSSSLQVLNLQQSLVSELFPDTFTLLPSLKFLDLSENLIVVLRENTFIATTNLQHLIISNNPMKCDTNFFRFYAFCRRHKIILQTSCKTKEKMENLVPFDETTAKPKLSEILNNVNKKQVTVNSDYKPRTHVWKPTQEITTTEKPVKTRENDCNPYLAMLISFLVGVFCGIAFAQLLPLYGYVKQNKLTIHQPRRVRHSLLTEVDSPACSTPIMNMRRQNLNIFRKPLIHSTDILD